MNIQFDNMLNQFSKENGVYLCCNFCGIPLFGIQIDYRFFSIAILGFGISIES
jgi:hypothetical protein